MRVHHGFIVRELEALAMDITQLAIMAQVAQTGRENALAEAKNKAEAEDNPAPLVGVLPQPPGGVANWKFLEAKFHVLWDHVLDEWAPSYPKAK